MDEIAEKEAEANLSAHGAIKDRRAVDQQEITHAFSTVKCPTLANKPKVFVFDVCRGSNVMFGLTTHKSPLAAPDHAKDKVAPDTSEMPPSLESKQGPVMAICPTSRSGSSMSTASGREVPKLADMLTANATFPSYVAFGEQSHSLFIHNFCEHLIRLCETDSVHDILTYLYWKEDVRNRLWSIKR